MTLLKHDTKALLDVHEFYLGLLKQSLRHDVPLPAGLAAKDASETEREQSEPALRNWLDVLDLAITAPMLRDAFKTTPRGSVAASLLYHYVNKDAHSDTDRDKTDFIVTLLFRTPDSDMKWDTSGRFFGKVVTPPFEAFLLRTLGMTEAPFLPAEHQQVAREFDFVFEEIEDLRHFDQLIDSGLIQKARDLKNAFGASFYHPQVLALIASYNVYFGKRFDALFHAATKQIKEFADRLQAEGGSLMARVDGDVIVKQLADVQESKILQSDYGRAQDELRMLSKFKKAVDARRGTRESAVAAAAKPGPAGSTVAPKPAEPAVAPISAPLGSALNSSLEEIKFGSMMDSIRNAVKASNVKDSLEIPVQHGSMLLTAAEIDAFRADYNKEKSFRADFSNILMSNVALLARMTVEMADFKAKRNSAYLWKPHADSLSHLLNLSQTMMEKTDEVANTADARGLKDKSEVARASMERLREQVQSVAKTLQTMGTNQSGTY